MTRGSLLAPMLLLWLAGTGEYHCYALGKDDDSIAGSFLSVKNCTGYCMVERFAHYCEAIVNIDNLCEPGFRCCISSNRNFGDGPVELLVIDRAKSNLTRVEETRRTSYSSIASTSATSSRTTTGTTATESSRPCKGECVTALFALMCNQNIDRNGDCGDGRYCCVGNPFNKQETTTTLRSTTSTTSTRTTARPRPSSDSSRPCKGECVNRLFALHCVSYDLNGDCGDVGYCCITNSVIKQEPGTSLSGISSFLVSRKPPRRTTARDPGHIHVSYVH